MGPLEGRLAVVTGSSRGIGRAIALRFVRAGARVAGCARGRRAGSFLDDLADDERRRCMHATCDISVQREVARFRDEVQSTLGEPDIVVNNAGIVARGSALTLTLETWNEVLASNLTGTFLVTQAFLPAMKSKHGGRIINLSSIAGQVGMAGASVYAASKHAVEGLTKSAALEVAAQGVRVNAVAPGPVETAMLTRFTGGSDEAKAGLLGMMPAKRGATPEEIAQTIVFLASDKARFLTGQSIAVDGGYTAQ